MDPKKVYKFCPVCGQSLINKQEYLECSSCTCNYHYYINPLPTNAAIIENEKGEVLLVKRGIPPQKGFWDLPGGFINNNENFIQSIKRELVEELNIQIEVIRIIGGYTDSYLYQNIKRPLLNITALVKITGGNIQAADDVADFKFFPKDQILKQKLAFPSLIEAIQEYLKGCC